MEVVPLAIFSGDGSGQRHRQCGGAWVENRAVDGSAAQMVSGLYGFSMWEQADNLCVIVGRLLAQAKCKMCIVYLDTVFSPNDQMKRRGNYIVVGLARLTNTSRDSRVIISRDRENNGNAIVRASGRESLHRTVTWCNEA
jgi:hypothetical protein